MSDRVITWLLWIAAIAMFTFMIVDGIRSARSEPRYFLVDVPMPAAVVLIVCKTVAKPYTSEVDRDNAAYTGHEPREWATEHSMMVCRRQEVQLYDPAVDGGLDREGNALPPAAPQPFNLQRCQRAGLMLGTAWDAGHKSSSYRFWRVACPIPIIDTRTKEVIGWKMPECGHRDVVRCDVDTEI